MWRICVISSGAARQLRLFIVIAVEEGGGDQQQETNINQTVGKVTTLIENIKVNQSSFSITARFKQIQLWCPIKLYPTACLRTQKLCERSPQKCITIAK